MCFSRFYTSGHLLLQRSFYTRDLVVLLVDVGQRPNRRDSEWVDLPMALCVVVFDMLELCRLLAESLRVVPIQMPDPLVEVWVSRSTEVILAAFQGWTEHGFNN